MKLKIYKSLWGMTGPLAEQFEHGALVYTGDPNQPLCLWSAERFRRQFAASI